MRFESEFPSEPAAESSKDKKDEKKRRRVSVPIPASIASETEKPMDKKDESEDAEKPKIDLESLFSQKQKVEEAAKPSPEAPQAELSKFDTSEQRAEAFDDAESDPKLENLTDDEQKLVAEQYIESALPDAEEEVTATEDGSTEQVEAAANAALLAEIQARMEDGEAPEEALNQAYESVAETLGGEPETEATAEATEPELDAKPEAGSIEGTPAPEGEPGVETAPAPELFEASTAIDEDEASPAASSAGAGGPPPPPTDTSVKGFVGGQPSPSYGYNTTPSAPLTAARRAGETFDAARQAERERRAAGRGLLVGGILGYLIGRRRGRIKTEQRLLPIQEKLEKQVKELHQTIATKEEKIRKLAAQKSEATPFKQQRQEAVQRLREQHTSEKTPEAFRGAKPIAAVEATAATAEKLEPKKITSENLDDLNTAGLLELASTIMVDKQPLRQLYETGQLNEQSLRRVVREQLRGGNVHEAAARELVASQLPFEQDPRFRQQQAANQQSGAQAGATYAASQPQQSAHDPTMLPSPASHEFLTQETTTTRHQHEERRMAAVSIAVILAIGAAIALALLLG